MSCSIIIPVWNGRDCLPTCLEALLPQIDAGDEVIAVDNGSADGSVAWVRDRYPAVRVIENGRNLGFAGGCNVGLRAARGEVLLMLNQDAVPRPGWLAAMRDALTDPAMGIVGGKLLYPGGEMVQHAGGIIRWPRAIPDHWGHREPDDGRWDTPREVDYVTGAAWGFRREVWEAVGELDEGFWPAYFEDADYAFRVREAGWRVLYVSAAEAIHDLSSSLGEGSLDYHRAFHRGRLRFVLKHLPPERILDQFVPAEGDWLDRQAEWWERRLLGRVYRITVVSTIGEDAIGSCEAVVGALAGLATRAMDGPSAGEGGRAMQDDAIDLLEAGQRVEERPFRSDKPVLGPLIAWFRTAWNNVSTRWYVLPLLEQQNAFNEELVAHLKEMDRRLIALDRDQTALTRTVAELSCQLAQLNRRLDRLAGDEREGGA